MTTLNCMNVKSMDDYPANEVAFDQIKTQVVPVYAKNTDTSIVSII